MKKVVISIAVVVMMIMVVLGNSTYTVSEKHHVHTQNMGWVMEKTETTKTRLGETTKIEKIYCDVFTEEPYGSYVVFEK